MSLERAAELELDLTRVPWSTAGSFMALSAVPQPPEHPGRRDDVRPGLFLWDVSGARLWRWNAVFRIEGRRAGRLVEPIVTSATPSKAVLDVAGGVVEVTWDGPDTLRFRGVGAGLRFTETVVDVFDSAVAFPDGDDAWRLQMGEDAHYVLTRLAGTVTVEAPAVRTGERASIAPKQVDVDPGPDGVMEIALEQYQSGYRRPGRRRDFPACVSAAADAFSSWRARFPPLPEELERAGDLAAYLLSASQVGPRGLLARRTVLMSKNWMYAVWSWDHCFNALGLAAADPDAAWDQFMVVLDQQNDQGALPDITTDAGWMWGFVKPPVHGWTLRRLVAAGIVDDDRLREAYPRLARWTDWWLTYRDLDGDGLCEYFHGIDSGQDNATAFDGGFPAAAPDLAAFLVVQMDVLAEVADRLRLHDDAGRWRARADTMLTALLDRLWDGERFRVHSLGGGPGESPASECSASQIEYLPLVLGNRLPPEVRAPVVARLRANGSITRFGLASESPASPLYEADGYWRGPVWAPTTLLVVDGLVACGEADLAAELADGFLRACLASGFAENYDAVTGAPLRDGAYTWSASVFWALATR